MLWNASTIKGYTITAIDGQLGTVSDFLFDDTSWLIRWLVVDTGSWLSSRKVLLPTLVLGHIDLEREEFSVRLTREQVKSSPEIETDLPVSRRMENDVYDYYGWTPYWGAGLYMGGYDFLNGSIAASPSLQSMRHEQDIADSQRDNSDQHLRSIEAVTGYHIRASDGAIGHVEDFLIEDADWSIHFLVVDTKNWWPGKKVLVSPRSAQDIDWRSRLVHLNVDRQKVKDSPTYDASTTVDRMYEQRFHSHYGDTRPADPPYKE
jgi:hypothetical protein